MRTTHMTNTLKISILLLLLVGLFFASILLGYTKTSFTTLYDSLFNYTNTTGQLVIRSIRIPRAIIATFIGASLAISGLLMQSITKNPMASPSLFGVNAGAAFFVVLIVVNRPDVPFSLLVTFAFLGSIIATMIVYLIGGGFKRESNVIKLTLAGAATSAFFISLTQGLLHRHQKSYEEIIFWLTGSVEGRSLSNLIQILPFLLIGLFIAILLSSKLNILSLGDDTAKGLGQNITLIKSVAIIAVVLLAGSSVAIAGPISLVGLIIPHFVKSHFPSDYRILIPISGLLGAIFLLLSDILARFVAFPSEVPVGIITALVGAPFFIYIARKAEL